MRDERQTRQVPSRIQDSTLSEGDTAFRIFGAVGVDLV